jgi:hypothetical protein
VSVARSELISGVYTLCGEPTDLPLAQGGLPENLVFEVLTGIEAEMLRDLEVSPSNRRVAKAEITLSADQEDFLINEADFHLPAYAYLQLDANSSFWHPVEIVEHSALSAASEHGRLAISLAGTPTYGYFSWVPDGNQVLRLWYERGRGDSPSLVDSTELGSLYDEYLKIQTAAQCREFLSLELGDVMKARLVKSERQWQRYINRGMQRGSGFKSRVFTPPRWRRNYPLGDRTRFFLP